MDENEEVRGAVSAYLETKGFEIRKSAHSDHNHIWTRKSFGGREGVDIPIKIKGSTILLCRGAVSWNLYHPESLPEIAAILGLCHIAEADCIDCALPVIAKNSRRNDVQKSIYVD
jgi:hypothetical protein